MCQIDEAPYNVDLSPDRLSYFGTVSAEGICPLRRYGVVARTCFILSNRISYLP